MHGGRLFREEPPSDREVAAAESLASSTCKSKALLLLPGAPQICRGDTVDGTVIASLSGAEIGTFLGAGLSRGFDSSASALPILAFGDLWTLSAMDASLVAQRAARLRYVPQENLREMALAPFSGEVLRRPEVWGGIAGTFAAGLLFSQLVEGGIHTQDFGKRPVLWGREVNTAVGYPLAGAIGVGLFEHVALAEESAFRGLLQSGFARKYGETRGLIYGSVAFGLIHASNAIFIDDPADRVKYLALGVPFITLIGSYLGYVYKEDHYSLGPSIAVHFWYDFLVEATAFAFDPKNSPLALRVALPF